MKTEIGNASVWTTRSEDWDGFLNDPALGLDIETVRRSGSQVDSCAEKSASISSHDTSDDTSEQGIAARLMAYETPITDEILRQSIQ